MRNTRDISKVATLMKQIRKTQVEGDPIGECLAVIREKGGISNAAAAMGRAGRGESKRRGDADHYRATVAKRWGRSTGERPRGDYISWGAGPSFTLGIDLKSGRVEYPISGQKQRARAKAAMIAAGLQICQITRWTGTEWKDTGLAFYAH